MAQVLLEQDVQLVPAAGSRYATAKYLPKLYICVVARNIPISSAS